MKKIVLTGGGTAGHVTPNIALLPALCKMGCEIHYIGDVNGMEKRLMAPFDFVTYHGISTGKLRRYLSVQNLKDPFKVLKGISQRAQKAAGGNPPGRHLCQRRICFRARRHGRRKA